MPSHGPPGDPHGLDWDNPWAWYVEDDPDIAYNALRPQQGSNSFLEYWRKRAKEVWEEYQGRLGTMALAGTDPSLEYVDFLQNYQWQPRYAELGPEGRESLGSGFAPGLRWYV